LTRSSFAFDDDVADLLGAGARALRGVTLRHLLEHTHGCDDSLLAEPLQRRGRIDTDDLVARIAGLRRIAPPGAIYSYGNLGAWLVATVLERVCNRGYAALVRDEILAPLRAQYADGPWCAATGAGLALTAQDLVQFLAYATRMRHELWPADAGPDPDNAITPLPGWNPIERGVRLGWKSSGAGWYGHQSAWPRASAYVRVHTERRLAVAVFSAEQPAAVVAMRVFGARLPELFDLRPPSRPLGGVSHDGPRWPARYEHAAHVVSIEPMATRVRFMAQARNPSVGRREAFVGTLRHVSGGVYFAEPATELIPYVQLVTAPDVGAPLLWNGRFVLRRSESGR